MEEIFTCNECLNPVHLPALLKCQHTFCIQCCQKLLKIGFIHTHSPHTFSCPRCRTHTLLEDGKFQLNEELNTVVRISLSEAYL